MNTEQPTAFPYSDYKAAEDFSSHRKISEEMQAAKSEKGMRLSDPALRYIAALYDPRQCYESPWIPLQAAYSQKSRVFARGSFSTGTTGFGFAVARGGPANDAWCVQSSTATSVGGAATTLTSFTNLQTANSNSPYTTAQHGVTATSVQSRMVGMALYVRYAGTELNRGGDFLLLEEPNHQSIGGNYSYNQMLAVDGCKRIPMTQGWVHVSWCPNNTNEMNFTADGFGNVNASSIGIAVTSATANAQPFEYELHEWVEYIGSPARSASVSFEDPIGAPIILAAGTMFQQIDCTLGLDGYMRAIHAQARNCSGILARGAPAENWAGLLPYLPAIAEGVGTLAYKAGKQIINHYFPKKKKEKSLEKKLIKTQLLRK